MAKQEYDYSFRDGAWTIVSYPGPKIYVHPANQVIEQVVKRYASPDGTIDWPAAEQRLNRVLNEEE